MERPNVLDSVYRSIAYMLFDLSVLLGEGDEYHERQHIAILARKINNRRFRHLT